MRNADGSLTQIQQGMQLPENAEIITENGAYVVLMADGMPPLTIGENREFLLSMDVFNVEVDAWGASIADPQAAAEIDPDIARVLAALEDGVDPFEVLDATAAVGNTGTRGGGFSDGGSSFTRIMGLVESTTPLSLSYPHEVGAASGQNLGGAPIMGGGVGAAAAVGTVGAVAGESEVIETPVDSDLDTPIDPEAPVGPGIETPVGPGGVVDPEPEGPVDPAVPVDPAPEVPVDPVPVVPVVPEAPLEPEPEVPSDEVEVPRPPVVDTTPPEVTVTINDDGTVSFAFSEAVQGFDLENVIVNNGTLSNLTQVGNTYTADLAVDAGFDGQVTVDVPAGSYADASGNLGLGGSAQGAFDTLAPTLTITTDNDTVLAVGETAGVTFSFSEAVEGFVGTSVVTAGGSLSGFTKVDDTTWTATFTKDATDMVPSITVADNSYTDVAGNAGTGASQAWTADVVAPKVTITINDDGTVTFEFSEEVKDFVTTDVQVTNGFISNLTQDGNSYTANLTVNPNVNGEVTVEVPAGSYTDMAGNAGLSGFTQGTFDTVPPTLTLTGSSVTEGEGTKLGDQVKAKVTAEIDKVQSEDLIITLNTGDQITIKAGALSASTEVETSRVADVYKQEQTTEEVTVSRVSKEVIIGNGTAAIIINDDSDAVSVTIKAAETTDKVVNKDNLENNAGFTVKAKDPYGKDAEISIHNNPSGFGVLSQAELGHIGQTNKVHSGHTSEIGVVKHDGKWLSESIEVAFVNPISTLDVAFAWRHNGEKARVDFYDSEEFVGHALVRGGGTNTDAVVEYFDKSGVLKHTESALGGTDKVDLVYTFKPGSDVAFNKAVFSADGQGSDYLIHSIEYQEVLAGDTTTIVGSNEVAFQIETSHAPDPAWIKLGNTPTADVRIVDSTGKVVFEQTVILDAAGKAIVTVRTDGTVGLEATVTDVKGNFEAVNYDNNSASIHGHINAEASDDSINAIEDTNYVLKPDDFGDSSQNVAQIKFGEMPKNGDLYIAKTEYTGSMNDKAEYTDSTGKIFAPLSQGDIVDIQDVENGNVIFKPHPNTSDSGEFTFSVSNGNGNFTDYYTTSIAIQAVADEPKVSLEIAEVETVGSDSDTGVVEYTVKVNAHVTDLDGSESMRSDLILSGLPAGSEILHDGNSIAANADGTFTVQGSLSKHEHSFGANEKTEVTANLTIQVPKGSGEFTLEAKAVAYETAVDGETAVGSTTSETIVVDSNTDSDSDTQSETSIEITSYAFPGNNFSTGNLGEVDKSIGNAELKLGSSNRVVTTQDDWLGVSGNSKGIDKNETLVLKLSSEVSSAQFQLNIDSTQGRPANGA